MFLGALTVGLLALAVASSRVASAGRAGGSALPARGDDEDDWERLATATGLVRTQPRFLTGQSMGPEVTVDDVVLDANGPRARHAIRVRVQLPAAARRLRIRRQVALDGRDLVTGDDAFDKAVHLEGATAEHLPPFSAPVRETLAEWVVEDAFEGSSGYLTRVFRLAPSESARFVRETVALVRRLAVSDPIAALGTLALSDPVAAVRLRSLRYLAGRHRTSATTRAAAAAGLTDADAEVRVAALSSFAELESPALVAARLPAARGSLAEPALLRLLDDPETPVRTAAARALGQVGTIAAVEPLLAAAEGFTLTGGLKDAARDAVRRIQQRLGDADSGRITLVSATDRSGDLSLATDGGALSIAPGDAARGPSKVRD